jgi:hypothetical protein
MLAVHAALQFYSWSSYDVINLTGANSKSRHSHQSELIVHCMCWPCVWWQIHLVFGGTPVQHKHQYILGWPTVRFNANCRSETQEFLRLHSMFKEFNLLYIVVGKSNLIGWELTVKSRNHATYRKFSYLIADNWVIWACDVMQVVSI